MANIITNTNVFEFMGTPSDQRQTHGSMITDLITSQQRELERTLQRKVTSQTASSVVLRNGKNCLFKNDVIYLKYELFDFYSITALSEEGTSLTESTSYNDGNDYLFDSVTGTLTTCDGTSWSTLDNAITISGKYGYVESDDSSREDIKHVLKEIVAMRSGLWTKTFVSDGGTVTTSRDQDSYLQDKIASHINYSLI